MRQERKPQNHLINILKATKDHHPNFALFLGAGSSVTSGVKMAGEMIDDWCKAYHAMYEEKKDIEKFLKTMTWRGTSEEYSILFELLYDQPSQRREYIESCVKDAKPSWGYIYLVNLLKNNIFNTVFTTNFDDLLNESCYQFSNDVRPIVCAHDSSIRSVRITSKRTKIVKLHGDFLFDNIKNTITEIETLEDNMKEKFKQFASEFGIIFVGYSGHDRSVMDTLNLLLKSDSNFPHGIYWCVRKGSEISSNVDLLSRFPKFKIVEIEGFDEFFADVHTALELKLQKELSDPYGSLVDKLNGLIKSAKIPEPVPGKKSPIQKDIEMIGATIEKMSIASSPGSIQPIDPTVVSSIPINYGDGQINLPIPFRLLADIQERKGNHEQAMAYIIREIDLKPSSSVFTRAFDLLSINKLDSFSDTLLQKLKESKEVFADDPEATFNIATSLILSKFYDLASDVLDFGLDLAKKHDNLDEFSLDYYNLNKIQIKVHQGVSLEATDKSLLEKISISGTDLSRMGSSILLGDYAAAESLLSQVIAEEEVSPEEISRWPIIQLLKPHLKNSSVFALKKRGRDIDSTDSEI